MAENCAGSAPTNKSRKNGLFSIWLDCYPTKFVCYKSFPSIPYLGQGLKANKKNQIFHSIFQVLGINLWLSSGYQFMLKFKVALIVIHLNVWNLSISWGQQWYHAQASLVIYSPPRQTQAGRQWVQAFGMSQLGFDLVPVSHFTTRPLSCDRKYLKGEGSKEANGSPYWGGPNYHNQAGRSPSAKSHLLCLYLSLPATVRIKNLKMSFWHVGGIC